MISISSIFGQQDQFSAKGGVDITPDLQRLFEMDAARLALRQSGNLKRAAIEIEEAQWRIYYNLLIRLYQRHDQARELFNCGIHTSGLPSVDYIELIYDREVTWAQPLQKGVTSTDEPTLSRLIEEQNLIIQSNESFDYNQDALIIRAARPINMEALANQFKNIKGVSSVKVSTKEAMNTDVQMEQIRGGWKVVYTFLFEDQLSHSWSFYVPNAGRIKLIEEEGDPLPDSWQCQ